MKKLINLFKKIVISAFILYGYNLIASPINLIIPINLCTIGIISILGIASIFPLIIILVLVY